MHLLWPVRPSLVFLTASFLLCTRSYLRTWMNPRKNMLTCLPAPQATKKESNIFGFLKNCIGKELSSITMPLEFNEPLSFLQRISEYMEYSYLLRKANEAQDPIDRLQYVSAFAVSALASNWERLNKPFNPLLSETYELCRKDLGFRLVCEQVSHHPPISAFHAESDGCFKFYGNIHPRLKFWGKSLEIKPEGTLNVELLSHKEVYSWRNVNCCVHNILIGKLWFEQHGMMEIHCHTTNYFAQLNFKSAGWFCKDLHRVEGFLFDSEKKKIRFLYGKWINYLKTAPISDYEEHYKAEKQHHKSNTNLADNSSADDSSITSGSKKMVSKLNVFSKTLTVGSSPARSPSPEPPTPSHDPDELEDESLTKSESCASLDLPNSEYLWQVEPRPQNSSNYYNFTAFALALNEIMEGDGSKLPPTDCRLRPDIRKLEEGDTDGAAQEKNRLEEKQREARKRRKKRKESWQARWFDLGKVPHLKHEVWVFNNRYWDRDFSNSPDIF